MLDVLLSCLLAFLAGGTLCLIAQILIDFTKLTPARILVLYVSIGVLTGALGIFKPLRDVFGAGVTVPLFGFGGVIAEGVKEAVDKEGLLGALSGPLTAAAVGTTAALVFGYLSAIIFRAKPKDLR